MDVPATSTGTRRSSPACSRARRRSCTGGTNSPRRPGSWWQRGGVPGPARPRTRGSSACSRWPAAPSTGPRNAARTRPGSRPRGRHLVPVSCPLTTAGPRSGSAKAAEQQAEQQQEAQQTAARSWSSCRRGRRRRECGSCWASTRPGWFTSAWPARCQALRWPVRGAGRRGGQRQPGGIGDPAGRSAGQPARGRSAARRS